MQKTIKTSQWKLIYKSDLFPGRQFTEEHTLDRDITEEQVKKFFTGLLDKYNDREARKNWKDPNYTREQRTLVSCEKITKE